MIPSSVFPSAFGTDISAVPSLPTVTCFPVHLPPIHLIIITKLILISKL